MHSAEQPQSRWMASQGRANSTCHFSTMWICAARVNDPYHVYYPAQTLCAAATPIPTLYESVASDAGWRIMCMSDCILIHGLVLQLVH